MGQSRLPYYTGLKQLPEQGALSGEISDFILYIFCSNVLQNMNKVYCALVL